MKKELATPDSFTKILGGSLMVAGVVTLMTLPLVAGSNALPEGILIFGLVSILGGWALTLAGIKPNRSEAQPAMGD